jgi:protease-4
VDQLGGFYDAVDKAKALAGIKGEVRLKRMTTPMSPLGALGRAMGADTSAAIHGLVSLGRLGSEPHVRALMDQVGQAQLREQGADLLAPLPTWR